MAEVTSALGFDDLVLRIAREAGIAYYGTAGIGRASVPIDRHDLSDCIEIANDAIRRFISDGPPKGWRWSHRIMSVAIKSTRVTGTVDSASTTTAVDLTLATSYDADDDLNGWWIYILTGTGAGSYAQITDYTALTGTVTVADWLDAYGNPGGTDPVAADTFAITENETIGGDIARYPLPEYFAGDIDGKISYTKDSNHGGIIEWRDESFIRDSRATSVTTGYPRYAAIRPLEHAAGGFGPKRRFEIIFDPQPGSDETVEFPYSAHFNGLQLESAAVTTFATEVATCSALANLYPTDYFKGWVIKVVSGTGLGSYALVTAYTAATGAFTVADFLAINGAAAGVDPASTASSIVVQPVYNLHPAGIRFDECIKAACLAEAEERIEDISAGYGQKYQAALQRAYAIDMRAAPRKLGSMNSIRIDRREHDNRLDVTYE